MIKLLIVLSLAGLSLASFYYIPGEIGKSKDHEGHCYYADRKILLKVGATIHTERCEEISCNDDYSISIAGCGAFSMNDPTCKTFVNDHSKPYPTCCTTFICVEPADGYLDSNHLDSNHIDQIERNTLD